jgi:hypothetical protein
MIPFCWQTFLSPILCRRQRWLSDSLLLTNISFTDLQRCWNDSLLLTNISFTDPLQKTTMLEWFPFVDEHFFHRYFAEDNDGWMIPVSLENI